MRDLFRLIVALIRGGRQCTHCGKIARKPFRRDRLPFCNMACWKLRQIQIATTTAVTLEQRARQADRA